MRPRFLDQPYFSQRTPRTDTNQADYACPLVIHSKPQRFGLDQLILPACLACAALLTLALLVYAALLTLALLA